MQRQDQRGIGSNNSKPQQENQQNHQHPPPPAQPQKCPRCDSTNTKFCYYNNYSLSQPRYFCKTCRRYWTQGGTLRNVPVGGGCRKGKRLKRSSSPDNHLNSTSSTTSNIVPFVSPLRSKTIDQHSLPSSSPLMPIGSSLPPSMYYPGGGFLSSLAAFQSFNQPINGGGGDQFGGSSLSLLPSFNLPFQQMHQLPQQNQQQQQQHQHLYLHQAHDLNLGSSSDGLEEKVSTVQANRPSTSHQDWSQTFNSPSHDSEATGGYWNSSTNTNTTNSNTNTIGVSLNPTHWTDHLAGYGPPPPSQQQQAPPPSTSSSSPPSFL
ncbi:hypothetical protein ACHQM5_003254 [Ranunculus cassubicifolius]